MTETKDFNASSGLNKPPRAEFELGYDEDNKARTWHIRASVAALPFVNALSGPRDADGNRQVIVANLVRLALVPDEVEPFLEMVNDPVSSPLTTGNLQELADYILAKLNEKETGEERPKEAPPSSGHGSVRTGRSSTAGSSSAATRRNRSKPSA